MAIIAISRGTFSGGKAIAENVAQRLGYKCISREMLRDAARDYGVSLDELSEALNKPPGALHGSDKTRMKYLAYIRVELLKAIKDENVVYHGLAGNLLLCDVPHLLGVRVIAGMEYRTEAAMERMNLMRTDAIDFIKKIDKKRDKWVKYLYNVDRNDPSLYSLVINLDHIDIEDACGIICTNASQNEYQRTPESQKRLNDLILAAEVKARIASDNGIKNSHICINALDGLITLSGNVTFIKDADRIRVATLDTPGVRDIDSKMKVMTITQAVGQFLQNKLPKTQRRQVTIV